MNTYSVFLYSTWRII